MVSRTAQAAIARYSPWQHLLETDVTLVRTPLLGAVDAVVLPEGIALNSTLSGVEQRCALAIALAHIEDRLTGRTLPRSREWAERVAARRLAPRADLLRARQYAGCMADLAELLRLTPQLLDVRLRDLESEPE